MSGARQRRTPSGTSPSPPSRSPGQGVPAGRRAGGFALSGVAVLLGLVGMVALCITGTLLLESEPAVAAPAGEDGLKGLAAGFDEAAGRRAFAHVEGGARRDGGADHRGSGERGGGPGVHHPAAPPGAALASSDVLIEVGTQRPSGAFTTSFLGGIAISYANLTNVVCRISRAKEEGAKGREHAVLLNSHFDSVIGSTGAGDDLSQVGVMLELASQLASRPTLLEHAVVLLFNGGEESNWPAAHGFVNDASPVQLQTPAAPEDIGGKEGQWVASLRVVLVMEAIGSGGREMLMRDYGGGSVDLPGIRPRGAAAARKRIADEIFKSGAFPGDTDLRVLAHPSGPLPGADLIFAENGFGYHTGKDAPGRIQVGDLARC
eukprot:CAMPEP_0180174078 /NCGR_PEP_ID=MMETSP0986-20121125/35939_1 /TAXON_ID=697907 /ORGANISM="non described non described, Strain CCMP2293" /LENGTH=375 /DNA_ID=CAMNT_0022126353 /DNA_START=9 /DNA_END=1135 /DNA_ORIENTATION=-